MCQHRFTCNITNRKDVLFCCPHLSIHLNKTLLADFYGCILKPQVLTVWFTANGNQNLGEKTLGRFTLFILHSHHHTIFLLFQTGHTGIQFDLGKLFAEPSLQHRNQITITARKQTIGHFHDRDLAAESNVG